MTRRVLPTACVVLAAAPGISAAVPAAQAAPAPQRSVVAITSSAIGVTASRAVLTGQVRARGGRIAYYFRYGTGSTLRRRTSVRHLAWTAGASRVSITVRGLRAHHTYRYRLVARGTNRASAGRALILVTPKRRHKRRIKQPIHKPPGHPKKTRPPPTVTTRPPAGPQYDTLVWSDDFNSPVGAAPDTTNWMSDLGAWGNTSNDLETDTTAPLNASTDGQGNLDITARPQTLTGPDGLTRPYSSARLESGGLRSWQYGSVQARMWIPAGQGLWPQFWMLGDNINAVGWPECGEIDIMEMLDGNPNTVYGTIHGPIVGALDSPYTVQGSVTSATSLADGYHTYGVVWSPGAISWTLDGNVYRTVRRSSIPAADTWVFDAQSFHLVLDLAVGGSWGGAPSASTVFPATLKVDWVRVYR